MNNTFPLLYQMSNSDCGPTSLMMIAMYYNRNYTYEQVYSLCNIKRNGISLKELSIAAMAMEFETFTIRCTFRELINHIPLPVILFWKSKHYIVMYRMNEHHIYIADPKEGRICYTYKQFCSGWLHNGGIHGFLLAIGDTLHADSIKNTILTKHVKVKSYDVMEIKKKALNNCH